MGLFSCDKRVRPCPGPDAQMQMRVASGDLCQAGVELLAFAPDRGEVPGLNLQQARRSRLGFAKCKAL